MDTQIIITLTALALSVPLGMAGEKPAPGKVKQDAFTSQSSRSLNGDAKLAWIAKMRTQLPIASREVGPFGMPQDPAAKVKKPTMVKKRKPGVFLNAIKAIKFTGVMPSDNKFIIGAREFKEGDRFPIIRGQRQFNIEIVNVSSDHILFKNVDTGEFVKRNLNTLPSGMKRGNGMGVVPGVIPENKKTPTPLNLDHIETNTTKRNH